MVNKLILLQLVALLVAGYVYTGLRLGQIKELIFNTDFLCCGPKCRQQRPMNDTFQVRDTVEIKDQVWLHPTGTNLTGTMATYTAMGSRIV